MTEGRHHRRRDDDDLTADGIYVPPPREMPRPRSEPPAAAPSPWAPAAPGKPGLATADLAGKPRLLNVFASWCVPCAAESPQLLALKQAGVEIDAIAIRDRPADVADFLRRFGDPYTKIGSDPESQVQLALGSSGVPESFIIDAKGVIRHQHIGDIRPEDVTDILRRIEAAR